MSERAETRIGAVQNDRLRQRIEELMIEEAGVSALLDGNQDPRGAVALEIGAGGGRGGKSEVAGRAANPPTHFPLKPSGGLGESFSAEMSGHVCLEVSLGWIEGHLHLPFGVWVDGAVVDGRKIKLSLRNSGFPDGSIVRAVVSQETKLVPVEGAT